MKKIYMHYDMDAFFASVELPFAVFVGENEISTGTYTVKNLIDSTEQKIGVDRMVSVVTDHRYDGDEDAAFNL